MQEDVSKRHAFTLIFEAEMKVFSITRTKSKYDFRMGGVHFFEILTSFVVFASRQNVYFCSEICVCRVVVKKFKKNATVPVPYNMVHKSTLKAPIKHWRLYDTNQFYVL